ncbi:MAG: MXAN_6640 family putative metalloprotease, partial [Bacteroidota bacterium]
MKGCGTAASARDGIAGILAKRFISTSSPVGLSQALVALVLFLTLPLRAITQSVDQPAPNQLVGDRRQADSVFLHIKQVLSGTAEGPTPIKEKCGFRFQSEIRQYWNLFSAEEQAVIKSLLARPTLQASVLSPSGHFRIHYDTTGRNTPALIDNADLRLPNSARAYVDSVAAILDHVWDVETRILGYPSPPPDQGAGGGNEYDVYVMELGGSLYGQTIFNPEDVLDSQRPNPTYMSYLEIDNDFIGYYTHGLQALRVTVAHEFHHAIQVGNYGFWQNDVYYYELTSTWMEDVVYPGVNDYIQYLSLYFRNTGIPFNVSNGYIEYGRAIWGKFIEKRFGRDRMRRSWEYLSSMPSLQAIDASLRETGTDFVREFPEFSLWHFYTGHRADPTTYFSEAGSFPELRPADLIEFIPPTATISSTARNLSIELFQLIVSGGGVQPDTVSMVLTNLNLFAAENSDDQSYSILYRFTTGPADETYET